MAPLTSASEMDVKPLLSKKDKFKQKTPGHLLQKEFKKKNYFTAKVTAPQEYNNMSLASTIVPNSFHAEALSTFKIGKRRRIALYTRSDLKEKRPQPEDSIIW